MHASLAGELGLRAILIETRHSEEIFFAQARRRAQRDERIGVAGIAYD